MSLFELVERERRALARLLNTSGLALVIGAIGAVLAVGALALGSARWLSLPRVVPFLLWLVAAGLLALGVRLISLWRGRMATLSGVAQQIERERALRDGSIRGTIEVAGSGALGRLGAEAMAKRLGDVGRKPLAPALRRRLFQWVGVGAVAAVVGAVALAAGTATAPDGWAALLHPLRAWNGELLEGVRMDSLPASVLRGERISITVRAPGRREVTLAHRRTGATWRKVRLPVIDGVATSRLEPLDADLTLYATDGRALSDTTVVRVVERPFIGEVNIRAQFSGYLGRQSEVIPLGDPIRVPQGTRLTVEGTSSTELREVTLTRGATTLILRPDGLRFSGPIPAVTGRYEWAAIGHKGPITDVPPALEIEVVPDSAPQVEILSPGGDTTVTAGDSLSLSVMATDDHGIMSVAIRSWIIDGRGQRRDLPERRHAVDDEGQWSGETPLRVDALRPGDALHAIASATDGSPWKLTGESREITIRLPTLSEQRDAIRDAADTAVARATATAAAQRQLQQRTQDASKQRQNQMSYESAEQAKALAREQRQLADRMEQIKSSAQQLEKQLKEAGALDSALQRQLEEAQKLLQDALTPELAEQLRKLEQASQQLSNEDARQAMTDLAQQQQKLREQLEKSVEMLKRAALEGAMSTMTDEAKELAERQRQIADSLARARNAEDRTEAQRAAKELAEKTREFSEEIRTLQQRLQQQKAEAGTERVNEAERRTQQSAEAMERAAQNAQRDTARAQNAQRDTSGGQKAQQDTTRGQNAQRDTARAQMGQQQQQGGQQGRQGGQQQGQQGGQQQGRQGGQQQGAQQQGGQQQGGQQQGAQNRRDQSVEDAARQAAAAMDDAARELSQAREQQVAEWKQELTTELDRSIQEMIQLAREQQNLEQQARKGTSPDALRAQQGSLQQGVEKSAERLQDAATRSSLLTQRSLRSVADARKRVEDATAQTRSTTNAQQIAAAMKEASEALNGAAASLVRDRERATESSSATGFAEMLKQLQEMAQQQGSLNSAAQSLLPRMSNQVDARAQQESRQLARQQRDVAAKLDDVGDRDDSGRAAELAKEARQIAAALEAAQLDPSVIERQQRLFRKMLDAGRLMEEEEREDTGKREAKSWTGSEVFTPEATNASGRAANRFQAPTWNELRGLTPDERRIVLEYFKRINGQRP
ncbi:MAG TPA: Ig-like domain-containing protein [Gemmatimonadaceae bacterium]